MATLQRRAVLFADLRGSTALFESLGNESAAALVGRAISAVGEVVVRSGGQVVKTLGDGLLAIFPTSQSALQAAMRMQDRVSVQSVHNTDTGTDVRLQLQIGIAFGEVVEVDGDCLGDAVNLAARLVEHAGDSEILITDEVLQGATSDLRDVFISLGLVHLRSRADALQLHLFTRRSPDTASTLFGDASSMIQPLGVRLCWRTIERTFEPRDLPVRIGRGALAEFIIDDPRVSRSHARVEGHGGALQLVDLSINGTYVRFARDDEILSLRRGSCTLHGTGLIGLGGAPDDPEAAVLSFEVLRPATGSGG